jgi:hypothetical protein
MTPSYAETLRPTAGDSTAPTPAMQAPLGITRAPALSVLSPLGGVNDTVNAGDCCR